MLAEQVSRRDENNCIMKEGTGFVLSFSSIKNSSITRK
jgi:hypothetical protein